MTYRCKHIKELYKVLAKDHVRGMEDMQFVARCNNRYELLSIIANLKTGGYATVESQKLKHEFFPEEDK